jgi:hypothetical protein
MNKVRYVQVVKIHNFGGLSRAGDLPSDYIRNVFAKAWCRMLR